MKTKTSPAQLLASHDILSLTVTDDQVGGWDGPGTVPDEGLQSLEAVLVSVLGQEPGKYQPGARKPPQYRTVCTTSFHQRPPPLMRWKRCMV